MFFNHDISCLSQSRFLLVDFVLGVCRLIIKDRHVFTHMPVHANIISYCMYVNYNLLGLRVEFPILIEELVILFSGFKGGISYFK